MKIEPLTARFVKCSLILAALFLSGILLIKNGNFGVYPLHRLPFSANTRVSETWECGWEMRVTSRAGVLEAFGARVSGRRPRSRRSWWLSRDRMPQPSWSPLLEQMVTVTISLFPAISRLRFVCLYCLMERRCYLRGLTEGWGQQLLSCFLSDHPGHLTGVAQYMKLVHRAPM